jgi:type IV/VI secretion system ImpK/VasF family protein
MNRVRGIIKIIKNVYNVSIYYNNISKQATTNKTILDNIDDAVLNKLDHKNITKGIHDGFVDLINNMCAILYTEFSEEQVKEFKFICCSYVDELMYEAIGESIWKNHLLEYSYFGTKISGEKIMFNIIKFLDNHSQTNKELSIVYYYILCTGYFGIYKSEINKLSQVKKELYKIIENEVLFKLDEEIYSISPSIESSIIKTQHMDKVKNYYKIYTQILLLCLSLLIVFISFVIYKGVIIFKIFR